MMHRHWRVDTREGVGRETHGTSVDSVGKAEHRLSLGPARKSAMKKKDKKTKTRQGLGKPEQGTAMGRGEGQKLGQRGDAVTGED